MKKPYIIGIAGGSASGKSTYSDRLAEKLNGLKVKLIHMDDYFKEVSERPVILGSLNGKPYRDDNHPLALELYKFHEDVEKAAAEEWDVIIAEGIFALWDEVLLPLLDLKLYVDCDSDERMARRIKRHLANGDNLDEITERYVQAVQPRYREYVEPAKWRADMIINGFQMSVLEYDIVAAWIYKMRGLRNG